jgi:hypothetical protein
MTENGNRQRIDNVNQIADENMAAGLPDFQGTGDDIVGEV